MRVAHVQVVFKTRVWVRSPRESAREKMGGKKQRYSRRGGDSKHQLGGKPRESGAMMPRENNSKKLESILLNVAGDQVR